MDPTISLYHYKAKCVSVHDGDTVRVDIDLGLWVMKKDEPIRLFGINSPEINKTESLEAGKRATEHLKSLILGKDLLIETIKDKGDKYGRLLANIYVKKEDGTWLDVNKEMILSGNAVPYLVG